MRSIAILCLFAAAGIVFSGCRGIATPQEKQARRDLAAVAGQYRPPNRRLSLPVLTPDSSLSNFVMYAVLNSPAAGAAFYDWSASVENITVSRSLPDPQLTFQAYIQNMITSLMPGFAWNFPGPGKLKARAKVASAQSNGKYFAFQGAVLQAAFNLERAYFQLGLLDDQLRFKRQTLSLMKNQAEALRAQNAASASTLANLLQIQSDRDRIQTDVSNLEDSRASLLANFKAALGLGPGQADPPVPAHFENSHAAIDADTLLKTAFERNPELKVLENDVRTTEAEMTLAYRDRIPDFSAALMADVKASPVLYWPQLAMSLPIWRDKLAAEVAGATAGQMAAESRLKAGQIALVVNVAAQLFACHETGRNLRLFENELIPKARQSLEIARADYRAGAADFDVLTGREIALADLQVQAAEARTDHEIALAELSLIVAGTPPAGAPFLPETSQR